LPIDRVFTMKGFGTVVTGTLVSGTIHKEDELQVFPSGKRVRVRGVQVHGVPADVAVAGQRTALNLAGATVEELSRGMMLAPPETLRSTSRVDVSLSLLQSAKPLKDRARVHFHSYTMEAIAEFVLYSVKQIGSGETAYAQLRLAEPALLLPGDRFIVRQFSPVVTIGGGVVLNSLAHSRQQQLHFLQVLATGDPASILETRIARHFHDGVSISELTSETGWTKYFMEAHLAGLVKQGQVIRLGDLLLHSSAMDVLKLQVVSTVEAFHKANPLVGGISKEELASQTDASHDEIFTAVAKRLIDENRIQIVGDLVRLPGRGVVMKDEEAESQKIIEAAFASAGLKVPFLKDVLSGVRVDKARAQKIVTLMLRDKVLVKISEDLVFHQGALAALKKQVSALKASTPKIDVARFKDLTGVSRKYAIPLLEYLDRERVTRRVGDVREIL
jgi:selenocysteine-specific elongation factor